MNYKKQRRISENNKLLENYSELVAQLLYNRNIKTKEKAVSFLDPKWEDNYDPFLLFNMEKSIDRVHSAIQNNEKITIYADYDADGIPGSIILANLFEKISYHNFDIYIPHRHKEGYGIHTKALEQIAQNNTKLIISIDVGITEHDAGKWCKKNNIDLIITDHHLPLIKNNKEYVPQAFSVIDPKQEKCDYPDDMICGAGVIFKFIQAFQKKYSDTYQIPSGWEKWLLDMVGIATISDMVPLVKENRIFARYGLQVIKKVCSSKTHRIGLKKLIWESGINHNYLNEEDIGFGISPKINASSRMSHPRDALALFLAQNEIEATEAVSHLISLNNKRKLLTQKTTQQAEEQAKKQTKENIIFVGNNDWQVGIAGLVASKLSEKYHKPSFVWSLENNIVKGSCRSVDNINLVELMQEVPKKVLTKFGGHKEAGGFSCKPENIEKLQKELEKAFQKIEQKEIKKEIFIDTELTKDHINTKTYQKIQKLAPFGIGNPKPLFLFKDIFIEKIALFGKEKNHLEIYFKNSFGKMIRGIAFFKTKKDFPKLQEQSLCNIVANIEYSVFMGKHELRLSIVDAI